LDYLATIFRLYSKRITASEFHNVTLHSLFNVYRLMQTRQTDIISQCHSVGLLLVRNDAVGVCPKSRLLVCCIHNHETVVIYSRSIHHLKLHNFATTLCPKNSTLPECWRWPSL